MSTSILQPSKRAQISSVSFHVPSERLNQEDLLNLKFKVERSSCEILKNEHVRQNVQPFSTNLESSLVTRGVMMRRLIYSKYPIDK